MLQPQVGDYVIYPRPISGAPWPAVVCNRSMLPTAELRDEAATNQVPLLLLYRHDVKWALPSKLKSIANAWYTTEEANMNPGLRDAYEEMILAIAENTSITDWKKTLKVRYGCSDSEGSESESESADELQYATAASLCEAPNPKRRSTSETQSEPSSPFKKQKKSGSGLNSYSENHPTSSTHGQSSTWSDGDGNNDPDFDENETPFSSYIKNIVSETSQGNTSIESEPHMAERRRAGSDEMVRFVIGVQEKTFYIPYDKVKEHFDDARWTGGLVVKNAEDEDYTFHRSRLREVLPDDFGLVKDYILNGEFGPLRTDCKEKREELFALCVSAWDVADRLGMDGLLRYITQRLEQTTPWNPLLVLEFAKRVFEGPGLFLETHKLIGDMLTCYIAEHYWEYIREHGTFFSRLMQELQDLAQNIHSKMGDNSGKSSNANGKNEGAVAKQYGQLE